MTVPIIIPSAPRSTCPECGKPERIIAACDHCGYVYRRESWPWWNTAALVVALVVGAFLFFSFVGWLMERSIHPRSTGTYFEFAIEALKAIGRMLGDLW